MTRDTAIAHDHDWLVSIGFQERGINGWSILLPTLNGVEAITELFVDYDGQASLAQGYPDDAKAPDDIVVITSRVYKTRGDVLQLLAALGRLI